MILVKKIINFMKKITNFMYSVLKVFTVLLLIIIRLQVLIWIAQFAYNPYDHVITIIWIIDAVNPMNTYTFHFINYLLYESEITGIIINNNTGSGSNKEFNINMPLERKRTNTNALRAIAPAPARTTNTSTDTSGATDTNTGTDVETRAGKRKNEFTEDNVKKKRKTRAEIAEGQAKSRTRELKPKMSYGDAVRDRSFLLGVGGNWENPTPVETLPQREPKHYNHPRVLRPSWPDVYPWDYWGPDGPNGWDRLSRKQCFPQDLFPQGQPPKFFNQEHIDKKVRWLYEPSNPYTKGQAAQSKMVINKLHYPAQTKTGTSAAEASTANLQSHTQTQPNAEAKQARSNLQAHMWHAIAVNDPNIPTYNLNSNQTQIANTPAPHLTQSTESTASTTAIITYDRPYKVDVNRQRAANACNPFEYLQHDLIPKPIDWPESKGSWPPTLNPVDSHMSNYIRPTDSHRPISPQYDPRATQITRNITSWELQSASISELWYRKIIEYDYVTVERQHAAMRCLYERQKDCPHIIDTEQENRFYKNSVTHLSNSYRIEDEIKKRRWPSDKPLWWDNRFH